MRVLQKRPGLPTGELVIDRLRREVHEREVVGSLVGPDVLARDRVDVRLHVARKELFELLPLDVVAGAQHPLEVVEWELGVDRDDPVDLDHRVDPLPAREPVLQRVGGRREPVGQELAEQKLSEPAAGLRRAQDLLQLSEPFRLLG